MARAPGRDQRGPMERLVRLAAALKVAGRSGITADKLVQVAGFEGENAVDLLDRDLRYLRQQGWKIDNTAAPGTPGHYRMTTVDNRFRVGLSSAQQVALRRAVLLADRADLVTRLGLPPQEEPESVATILRPDVADPTLSKVIYAVRHRCRLSFRYNGKDRLVHPESIRSQNERWYLRGVEDGRDVVKLFVVSRMSRVRCADPGTSDPVPPEARLNLHPMRWQIDPPVDVVVRTTREHAPDVQRWLGAPKGTTATTDAVDLTYHVTHRSALYVRMLELGPRARVLSPDDVREELASRLAAVADRGNV